MDYELVSRHRLLNMKVDTAAKRAAERAWVDAAGRLFRKMKATEQLPAAETSERPPSDASSESGLSTTSTALAIAALKRVMWTHEFLSTAHVVDQLFTRANGDVAVDAQAVQRSGSSLSTMATAAIEAIRTQSLPSNLSRVKPRLPRVRRTRSEVAEEVKTEMRKVGASAEVINEVLRTLEVGVFAPQLRSDSDRSQAGLTCIRI